MYKYKLTKMNLRKKHDKLKASILSEFKRLVPKDHTLKLYHKFIDANGEMFPIHITDIKEVISELELTDTITDLPNIYYNDKNGKEREGYILEISEAEGLKLYDYDKAILVKIGFSEINTLLDAIKVVEVLDEASKTPSREEIIAEMELHNADEAGIDNQWSYEDAEYHLLLSDKYHNPQL